MLCWSALVLWDVLTLECNIGVNIGTSARGGGGSHPCCYQPSAKCSVAGLEQTARNYSRVASLQYQTCRQLFQQSEDEKREVGNATSEEITRGLMRAVPRTQLVLLTSLHSIVSRGLFY